MVRSQKGAGRKTLPCPVCSSRRQKGTIEVYVVGEGEDRYFFNVDKAKTMVGEGRAAIAIAEPSLRRMIMVNDYSPAHLDHVKPDRPGIMVERFGGAVLMDGIHRAVRCLKDGRIFHAYTLTYEQSLACLIRQEIASSDAASIVAKLRKVMRTAPGLHPIEAQIECDPEELEKARAMLTPEERSRLVLRVAPRPKGDG